MRDAIFLHWNQNGIGFIKFSGFMVLIKNDWNFYIRWEFYIRFQFSPQLAILYYFIMFMIFCN
ncbi:putative membrane protein [Burkholderia pseudomallei]|nr:putative membrane protein [Burkholderia pseudomallei]